MDWNGKRERALMRRFGIKGDGQAFAELFEMYRARLWRLIRTKVYSREDAQDILQETAGDLARYLTATQPPRLLPVAYQIAKCRVVDHIRRQKRNPATESLQNLSGGEQEPADPNPAAPTLKVDALRKLMAQYDVNPEQQEAMILRYIVGYTVPEVAAILDVPAETVRGRIRHAKLKMRNHPGGMP